MLRTAAVALPEEQHRSNTSLTVVALQALSRRSAGPLRTAPVEGQPLGGIAALLNGPGMGTGNINYGNHLAVGLAAGLLFLSGGQASISTSNESIAALLIALYPVWPCSPTDHRSHLQVCLLHA